MHASCPGQLNGVTDDLVRGPHGQPAFGRKAGERTRRKDGPPKQARQQRSGALTRPVSTPGSRTERQKGRVQCRIR